jgi:hypothetical protein
MTRVEWGGGGEGGGLQGTIAVSEAVYILESIHVSASRCFCVQPCRPVEG